MIKAWSDKVWKDVEGIQEFCNKINVSFLIYYCNKKERS